MSDKLKITVPEPLPAMTLVEMQEAAHVQRLSGIAFPEGSARQVQRMNAHYALEHRIDRERERIRKANAEALLPLTPPEPGAA